MVAAKLDQSRVLETKFRQNQLTLEGRSAGQRHRQTNSAENNGASDLPSGQKLSQSNVVNNRNQNKALNVTYAQSCSTINTMQSKQSESCKMAKQKRFD